ncbi:MAG: hypothetical protein ACXVFQ_24910 [Solirubrobacteraceae bacterium]
MRVELATATSGPGIATVPRAPARRWRIDGFEAVLLAVFGLLSVWVLGLDLFQVIAHGRVWTGTDGLYLVDQMQYLAWVQSASHHLLIANLFVLRPTPADYFQPAIAISGGLSALGLAPWLALLLWKPIAVVSFFFAVRAFVYRSIEGLWPRRAALTLALFFGSFTIVYGDVSVLGDLWPAFLSWGYVFGLLALAAIVVGLLRYDTARRRGKVVWLPGVLGACATLMHPWQGELLILLVVGGELVAGGLRPLDRRRIALAALTIGLTVLPLLYYAVLGRADPSWKLARDASRHDYPLWSLLLAILPLLIPALLAYRRRARTFLGATTQAWPGAVLLLYFISASALGATPLHAFQGISIPLAVLAVQGVASVPALRRLPRAALIAAALIALATIPNAAFELTNAADTVAPQPINPTFIEAGERDALNYLAANKTPGGVLSRSYLGALVPAKTGRRVFVGDCLWSQPHCYERVHGARVLFGGGMTPRTARTFVKQTGAAFVLSDCESPANIPKLLGPMILSTKRFGCARVYELDAPSPPTGPLAESRANAAVRAPRRQ